MEKQCGTTSCLVFDKNDLTQVRMSSQGGSELQDPRSAGFKFSRVFNMDSSQSEVYDIAARPIIDAVVEGFNGTVFAYG